MKLGVIWTKRLKTTSNKTRKSKLRRGKNLVPWIGSRLMTLENNSEERQRWTWKRLSNITRMQLWQKKKTNKQQSFELETMQINYRMNLKRRKSLNSSRSKSLSVSKRRLVSWTRRQSRNHFNWNRQRKKRSTNLIRIVCENNNFTPSMY